MPEKTALYDVHASLGAKIVEFGGFLMPVQYAGIVQEHRRVRASVGVFDISHMGEFLVRGADAEQFLNYMTTNNVGTLQPGQAQYTVMCYPEGGIVDDLLVYKYPDYFMLVVNAANITKDWDWLQKNQSGQVELEDASRDISLIAVQGPDAPDVVKQLASRELEQVKYYHFTEGEVAGVRATISRTGYTGEPGFELYVPPDAAGQVWEAVLQAGEPYDIEPIGLGARDTLRLEAGYCLYGNDIDETTTPIEAGLNWLVKLQKGEFIGRSVLRKVKETGPARTLVGFELVSRGIPRHDYPIVFSGNPIGRVTSGTQSPMLQKGIGLGYVDVAYANEGTTFNVRIRDREIPAKVVDLPFYDSRKK